MTHNANVNSSINEFKMQDFGVSIAANTVENSTAILVRGKFKLPIDEKSIVAQGAEVLKHVVIVITRSGNYQALPPFRDVIVFDDDIQIGEQYCSGFFSIDLRDHLLFDGEGDYYITCSMGTFLSNTEKVSIEPIMTLQNR